MSGSKTHANFLDKNAKEAQKFFLENYWQKRPLLVRAAFPGGISAVDPDSLAGLACQEGIDSRLIFEKGKDRAWQTSQGPFAEEVFATLPKTHWTLLVQAVDRLVPEVSSLRDRFRFLPNWRLDDIMISYAADQGSVGPHTDHYDVFLIQAMGRRRWEYSDLPLDVIEYEDGLDLKILKDFRADQSFVLEEGDMLYLPPRVAHHGVAVGECMTYSIGFRAPTQNEMLVSFSQFLLQSENPDDFFTDDAALHGERLNAGAGGILAADRQRLRAVMVKAIEDEEVFHRWIGGFLTEPRSFHEAASIPLQASGVQRLLAENLHLFKVEGGRCAYFATQQRVYLSVEGETVVLGMELLELARLICESDEWEAKELLAFASIEGFDELLIHLWNQGFLRGQD